MTDADASTPSPAHAKGVPVLIPATIHLVGPEDALVTVGTGGPFPVPLSALVVATRGGGASADPEDAAAHRVLPAVMTPAFEDVLGQMNYFITPIAHLLQAAGADISRRYESEQAHVLFRFLHLALAHGDGWRARAAELIAEARAAVAAGQGGSNADG